LRLENFDNPLIVSWYVIASKTQLKDQNRARVIITFIILLFAKT